MKKLISMVLVLCMAATMVSALAETDVTGEWYGSMMGFSMKMVLNADGTGEMTVVGQGTSPATWTMEGDQITITANDSPATGTVTADGITLSADGMDVVFTREPQGESITLAAEKPDAAAEDFYGDWVLAYIESDGMVADASEASGIFPNIKLAEGSIEFVPSSEMDMFAFIFSMLGLTTSYDNGAMALTATADGANANGKIVMLEDGMIKLSLDSDDSSFTLVYKRAAE